MEKGPAGSSGQGHGPAGLGQGTSQRGPSGFQVEQWQDQIWVIKRPPPANGFPFHFKTDQLGDLSSPPLPSPSSGKGGARPVVPQATKPQSPRVKG